MSAIIILVILSISLAAVFLIAFLWAASSGQFQDNNTPSLRILHEQPLSRKRDKKKNEKDEHHDND